MMTPDLEDPLPQATEEREDGDPNADSSLQDKTQSCLSSSWRITIYALLVAVSLPLLALAVPCFLVLYPLGFIVWLSLQLPLPQQTRKMEQDDDSSGLVDMYKQPGNMEKLWYRILLSSLRVIARVSLVMIVGLALSIFVHRLKRMTLLGSPLWKWCLLSVILTAGYFEAITIIVYGVYAFSILLIPRATLTYYIKGSWRILTHVTFVGMALVSWLVYFHTEQGLKQASTPHPHAFEYVTWTFVSLFIGSVLFLLKSLLLAKWSVHAIYRRFEPRILITSVKYFFICLIVAGSCKDHIIQGLGLLERYGCNGMTTKKECDGDGKPRAISRKLSVTKHIMSRKMDLNHLSNVCRILKSLAEIMPQILDPEEEGEEEEEVVHWLKSVITDTIDKCTPDGLLKLFPRKEGDETVDSPPSSPKVAEPANSLPSPDGAEDVVLPSSVAVAEPTDSSPGPNKAEAAVSPPNLAEAELADSLNGSKPATSSPGQAVAGSPFTILQRIKTRMMKSLRIEMNAQSNALFEEFPEMANALWRLVLEECSAPDHEFTFDDLKKWMVDAHKDCINMGRTIADATAMVTSLDLLLSCFIVLIVLIVWLLITGFASTKVLVTIATPLLALTFIFGDTAKTFFQGFIFCFVTHPFDVGDRCILDETELEVKSMNISTTTFIKIGSKEKRLYPNAQLATKAILNLGWQPDPKDAVEFTLKSSADFKKLKAKIHEFFEKGNDKYKSSYELSIKELGDNVKVTVHFSHVLTVHDLSHSQCFKKKNLQRFELLDIIREHIYIEES